MSFLRTIFERILAMSPRAWAFVMLCISLLLASAFMVPFARGDKQAFLPGQTTAGHYQIELQCNECHTPFGGVAQSACLKCHGDELKNANDSHPDSKFLDPRNAERVSQLDARVCVTCHKEHVPAATRAVGVTVPDDFCVRCHQDVGTERPTHKGFAFDSCSTGGCHNYHDNRALYEDFLKKHLHEPDLRSPAVVLARSAGNEGGPNVVKPLGARDQNSPPEAHPSPEVIAQWESSSHARAAVNCSHCHSAGGGSGWQQKPDHTACAGCHAAEVNGFLAGRHGMRLKAGMPPMTPALARLPMKPEARQKELGCSSCHAAHRYDTTEAAVESCLGCHNDKHSLGYPQSRHAKLRALERSGAAPKGSGVTCATCHLPRDKRKDGQVEHIFVEHNQNDNLRPNEKMARTACLACHGLGFTLNSLAEPDLVQRNFNGQPTKHVESLKLVESRAGNKTP
jgi:predicted CXXCH cytochrome family protein